MFELSHYFTGLDYCFTRLDSTHFKGLETINKFLEIVSNHLSPNLTEAPNPPHRTQSHCQTDNRQKNHPT